MTMDADVAPTQDPAAREYVLHSELSYACQQAREAQHHLGTPYPRSALESLRIAAEAICKGIRFREAGSEFPVKKNALMLDYMIRWLESQPEAPRQMIYWLDVIRTGGNLGAHAQPEGSREFVVKGIQPLLQLLECTLDWCFQRYYQKAYHLGDLPPAPRATSDPIEASGRGGSPPAPAPDTPVTHCHFVQLKALGGLRGWVQAAVFSHDSRRVASGGTDRVVRFWKTTGPYPSDGQQTYGGNIHAVAANPVRDEWAVGGSGGLVKLWGGPNNQPLILTGPQADVLALAYRPDGGQLAVGTRDGTVHLWDLATGGQHTCGPSGGSPVRTLAYSPDGVLMASGDARGVVCCWTHSPGGVWPTAMSRLEADARHVSAMAFLGNGAFLAIGGAVVPCVWDLTGSPRRTLLASHDADIVGAAVNRPCAIYAFASLDGCIRVYRWSDHQPVGMMHVHEQLHALAFSPDGRLLATGNSTGHTRLWRVAVTRG